VRDFGKWATCRCGERFEVKQRVRFAPAPAIVTENGHVRRIETDAHRPVVYSTRFWQQKYDSYAQCTRERDWQRICELNEVSFDTFGTRKEIWRLAEFLEPDETVFALTSGVMRQTLTSNAIDGGWNGWLVALTSERFLFLDAALLTSSIDSQSIRHERVQAVSASQGWLLGKIMVDLGSRVVTVDNCQKAAVKVMADLANKWLRELSNRKSHRHAVSARPERSSSVEKLEQLSELHLSGALTDEEFNAAKQRILAEL